GCRSPPGQWGNGGAVWKETRDASQPPRRATRQRRPAARPGERVGALADLPGRVPRLPPARAREAPRPLRASAAPPAWFWRELRVRAGTRCRRGGVVRHGFEAPPAGACRSAPGSRQRSVRLCSFTLVLIPQITRSLGVRLQRGKQLLACPEKPRADRADGTAERLGSLFIGEFLDVDEKNHRLKVLVQPTECGLDLRVCPLGGVALLRTPRWRA